MKDLKGTRLVVNVSANQARRRLKGHGFGVRKIASEGRNRALIIHTATGEHRRDLEALFQDVLDQTEQPSAPPEPEEESP